jgi:hypothetical protein
VRSQRFVILRSVLCTVRSSRVFISHLHLRKCHNSHGHLTLQVSPCGLRGPDRARSPLICLNDPLPPRLRPGSWNPQAQPLWHRLHTHTTAALISDWDNMAECAIRHHPGSIAEFSYARVHGDEWTAVGDLTESAALPGINGQGGAPALFTNAQSLTTKYTLLYPSASMAMRTCALKVS